MRQPQQSRADRGADVLPRLGHPSASTYGLGISQVRVNEIIKGKRGISAETAWLLAEAFG
ncbi:MAG: helix-turn-helix domain-containing protein [Myxococcales bacterium]|nr:helix-turn-helix domain-containing protein [Myxococcales bacterium]